MTSHASRQPAPRYQRGISRGFLFVLVILLLVIAGAGIATLLISQSRQLDEAQVSAATAAAVSATGQGADAGNSNVDRLLQRAGKAVADQRLLSPANDNAIELYLAVLHLQPNNGVAQEALREVFPFAARAAEQAIDQGNDADSDRQIALLQQADPHNFTVTLLRNKLQARKQAAPEPQQPTAAQVAATNAAAHPAPAVVAPTTHEPTPTRQVAAAAPPPVAAPVAHDDTTAPAAVAASSTAPVLIHRENPVYPVDAVRTGKQGWVDVSFTVQPDGSVANVAVTGAEPKRVFDRAAMAAVSRWQFSPGMRNGQAVPTEMKQRIDFQQ